MPSFHSSSCAAGVGLAAVFSLLVLTTGQADSPAGKKYALLVGVKDYDHANLTPLQYPENDVEELARLIDRAGSPFHGNVRLLTTARGKRNNDDQPTAANI